MLRGGRLFLVVTVDAGHCSLIASIPLRESTDGMLSGRILASFPRLPSSSYDEKKLEKMEFLDLDGSNAD